ncbi:MAG TPA: putative DNA binding domain-containing protein [Methanocorpusculum sp.]|nr:putative DNA binding domain-containing protein [Methanocorpusculum sp.]
MDTYSRLVETLISKPYEEEWFDFKVNKWDPHDLGQYISALSNAAAMLQREKAYLIWGIENKTHEPVGTTINYQKDYNGEPCQHYLARLTTPHIEFTFHETTVQKKRIVVLEIPAAAKVPTEFDGVRYIRIGSSKVNVAKYPERESALFDILRNGTPTITSTESEYQDLSFGKLFTYYSGRGISLREETFKQNLGLLTKNNRYNILAQLLSDDNRIPIRVSIFRGKTKASPLFSIKEFGNTCLLNSLEKIIEYGDVINLIQTDERNRVVERKDISLFDTSAFSEAIINAFVHNKWLDGNAPMITIYCDRIEILSRGTLAPKQTRDGFYNGESVPVNQKLSDIFLQLHISERSGRGVPKIVSIYGRDAYEFRENSIVVTLPFNRINSEDTPSSPLTKEHRKEKLNKTREKILKELRNNPNTTQHTLTAKIKISKSTVYKNIRYLKENGYIERIGSDKNGYWKVIE